MGRVARAIALIMMLCCVYPVMLHCQETIVPVTIDEHDRYEIILRLEELKVRRGEVKMLQSIIDRDSQQDAREADLNAKSVSILTQERDLWKEKADSYKKAYEDVMKGRSKKCWIAKVISLGLVRCN